MTKLEDIVSLCKRRGFIFPGSDVYGGMAGTWDFGPLGVMLKRNLMNTWWSFWVDKRDDMYGVDAALNEVSQGTIEKASDELEQRVQELIDKRNDITSDEDESEKAQESEEKTDEIIADQNEEQNAEDEVLADAE